MSHSAAISLVRRTFDFLLDLFYPPCCGGCGRAGLGWWCDDCDTRVPWLEGEAIAVAQPLDDGYPDLKVLSAAKFESPLREAIHRFKYEGYIHLGSIFGARMGALWARHGQPVDAIVPVPLHSSRLRERGFNQSALLAREVSTVANAPVWAQALRRVRATQQQARLDDPEARRANVRGAFVAAQALDGRAVLLIDDVFTTGATISACAIVLYRAGASRVIALTLARA
ncbi:MAG: ComF family protein [Chloroflexi bacterium]|jgi:ComF family protein|nr:ComF family protein [Chloroflexota bacterium]